MLKYASPVLQPAKDEKGVWDGIMWELAEDWTIEFKNKRVHLILTIRKGFRTDGGSIPKLFQNIISPLGVYLVAFLVHDALYATEYLPRSEADWILLEILQELGATWWRRNEVWSAVRIGGGFVWEDHTPETIAAARQMVSGSYQKSRGKLKYLTR